MDYLYFYLEVNGIEFHGCKIFRGTKYYCSNPSNGFIDHQFKCNFFLWENKHLKDYFRERNKKLSSVWKGK